MIKPGKNDYNAAGFEQLKYTLFMNAVSDSASIIRDYGLFPEPNRQHIQHHLPCLLTMHDFIVKKEQQVDEFDNVRNKLFKKKYLISEDALRLFATASLYKSHHRVPVGALQTFWHLAKVKELTKENKTPLLVFVNNGDRISSLTKADNRPGNSNNLEPRNNIGVSFSGRTNTEYFKVKSHKELMLGTNANFLDKYEMASHIYQPKRRALLGRKDSDNYQKWKQALKNNAAYLCSDELDSNKTSQQTSTEKKKTGKKKAINVNLIVEELRKLGAALNVVYQLLGDKGIESARYEIREGSIMKALTGLTNLVETPIEAMKFGVKDIDIDDDVFNMFLEKESRYHKLDPRIHKESNEDDAGESDDDNGSVDSESDSN